jgi:DNA (cytosine-5)-methyltransferase 1
VRLACVVNYKQEKNRVLQPDANDTRDNEAAQLSATGIAVELCSGMGGMAIGLAELGFEVARAYDIWANAVDVYNHNFPGEKATQCNLLSDKGRRLVTAEFGRMVDIDLLAAGPPCKGFSQLRNGFHDGRNGHNRVLAVMPEYVALLRPRIFIFENVPALLTHRRGKTVSELMGRLERPASRLRYRVGYRVYDAAASGTPQARKRVFILGLREGAEAGQLPEPDPDLSALYAAIRHAGRIPEELRTYYQALLDPQDNRLTSARQALSDLPVLGPGCLANEAEYASPPENAFQRWARSGSTTTVLDMRTPAVTQDTLARLKRVPPGGCARSIPAEHLNGLVRRYGSAYRRLHPDAPSTALSTKYDCVYHFAVNRSLSVREYARLQGIPDRFTFPPALVCRRSAYEMIGNSVPPLLLKRVLGGALGLDPKAGRPT